MSAEVRAALEREWAAFMVERNAQGKLTQAENWRRANPGEWYLLAQYRAGGTRPALATQFGRQMVEHVDAYHLTSPSPPPLTPAPPEGPFTVRDGNGTVVAFSDCFVRTAASTLIEKKHVRRVTGYGIGSMQLNYANNTPPPGRTTIRDCISEDVTASPPGKMGGTGEANFWLGNPTTLQRFVARRSGWMAVNIVARSQGSLLEDGLIEDVPVGLYFELATHDVLVRRVETRRIKPQAVAGGSEPNGILAARAGTKEWWHRNPDYGLTGPYNITYEDCLIYCPPPDSRFQFDPTCGDFNGAGVGGSRYLNCHFYGEGNAIMAPRNRAQNLPDVFIDDRCQFSNLGQRVVYHDLPIG